MTAHICSTSQYSPQIRQQAIADYAVCGNGTKVARELGIPIKTVSDWINSGWGQELLASIRVETQDEMIAGYTKMVRRNLELQYDRLEHGDVVGVGEDGKALRQAVRYRDLVVGAGIGIDKIRIMCNQPTSIAAADGALVRISEQLAAYAKDKREKVIEGHTVDT